MCSSVFVLFFFFQAEDGIRDLVRSRGLGDVYKRQGGNQGRDAAAFNALNRNRSDGNWDFTALARHQTLSLIHI